MHAVIIAAGCGSRMKPFSDLKPLTRLNGRPLIGHVIDTAAECGVKRFIVVTGYKGERLQRETADLYRERDIEFHFIDNPRWEQGNGISVLAAESILQQRFLLLMADHILSPTILKRLIAEPTRDPELLLAVDRRLLDNPLVDISDVTKVRTEAGRIMAIGKQLSKYDAFDTGAFSCPPTLFQALRESVAEGDQSLSGGVMRLACRGCARSIDIGDAPWVDIDSETMYAIAKSLLDSAA